MTVDVLCVLLMALLTWMGWRSGAIRQVLRIIAIVAVLLLTPTVSPIVRELVFGEPGRAEPVVEVTSIVIGGILIYAVIALVGWMIVRTLRFVSTILSLLDQLSGAALGAVKGALIVYLVGMVVVFLEVPLTERDEENRMRLRDGAVTNFVTEYNLLAGWQFPDLQAIHTALVVGQLVEESGRHDLAREDGSAAEFLRDSRVRELLTDDELMGWAFSQHFPMTLADGRVRELLNDDGLMEKLHHADWAALRAGIEAEEQ